MKNKRKVQTSILIISILVLAISLSYAFFASTIGPSATTNVNVTTGTTDELTFTAGDPISIKATQLNFGNGSGNLFGETTSSIKLKANNTTKTATSKYQVYFDITQNEYTYTKDTSTPELILTITDPTGAEVTSISGLNYVTSGDVKGFDITTKTGSISVASDYSITSTDYTNGVNQNWKFRVTYINLNQAQTANEGKSLTANALVQEEKK
jgi:hypothetical protein